MIECGLKICTNAGYPIVRILFKSQFNIGNTVYVHIIYISSIYIAPIYLVMEKIVHI